MVCIDIVCTSGAEVAATDKGATSRPQVVTRLCNMPNPFMGLLLLLLACGPTVHQLLVEDHTLAAPVGA